MSTGKIGMGLDRRTVLGGALGALGAAAMTAGAGPAGAQEKEVVIGAIFPLSGSSAQSGVDARHALETALDIINGSYNFDLPSGKGGGIAGLGGAKMRLVFADHQGDPQKGRAEAERLITQDKVVAIIGSFHSSVAATISTTTERYQIPYFSADNSSPSLNRRGLKYFFRAAAHDEMFTLAMFDFLDDMKKKGKKVDTVGLFHEDTIFGTDSSTAQRDAAKARGYNVVVDIKYRANSPSLTAEVQQIVSANPDVLMPSSYTTDGILLVKTMAELGYKPRAMLAQAAGFAEKSLYDAVGDKLDGLISRASFSLDLAAKRPVIAKVNEMFKARSGRDLSDNTSRQFMGLLILADAIDRAKSQDGTAIRDALAKTNIPGEKTIMPWSKVAFGEDGQNLNANPVLLQYLGGKFVTVYPEAVAIAQPKWPMNG